MSRWVIDSSLALAWALPDERTAQAVGFRPEVEAAEEVWVPALWWYEIANAIVGAHRRGRLNTRGMDAALKLMLLLPLTTDLPEELSGSGARMMELATARGVSAYDSAYLELALRRRLGLATLDERLLSAAVRLGLDVYPRTQTATVPGQASESARSRTRRTRHSPTTRHPAQGGGAGARANVARLTARRAAASASSADSREKISHGSRYAASSP